MATEEKSIHIIEFSGKRSDWDDWFAKFLAWAKCKGYKKLLTVQGDLVEVDKISTQDEYDLSVAGNSEQDKANVNVGQMNKLAYEYIILSIDQKTKEVMWHLTLWRIANESLIF